MKRIRILVADDHSLVRRGLVNLLKYQKDFSVVGEACNGKEAVEKAVELAPDVVIMDLSMPEMDGVEASRQIHESVQNANILILTTFGTSIDVARAINAGASGAIVKDSDDDTLLTAIRTVAGSGQVFSPEIAAIIKEPLPPDLTERQREILEAIVHGQTSDIIASRLGISTDAVNQHINAVRAKLGASTRREAVAIALKKHLLKV
ncbi:MAG: response regulator transcription factor [Kiritimatiellae bacterium]|nr:response regulator transcription factor [Kiritimatiellia bacterium]